MNKVIHFFARMSFCLSLLISSVCCSVFLNIDKPRIKEVFPSENVNVDSFVVPFVVFTHKMNHNATEKAISLYRITSGERKEPIGFVPFWETEEKGEKVFLASLQDLLPGRYLLAVGKSAESENGLDIVEGTNVIFLVGRDFYPPVLQQILPTNGSILLDKRTSFDIIFHEALDLPSPQEVVEFFPPIEYTVAVYSQTNGFRVIPLQDIPVGRILLIIKQVKDRAGNWSGVVYTNIYQMGTNIQPFRLLGVKTNGWGWYLSEGYIHHIEKTNRLVFFFSSPVSFSPQAIRISPPVEGFWTVYSNVVIFQPYDFWDIGQNYVVTVDGVRDNEGGQLDRVYSYQFFIANPFLSIVNVSSSYQSISLTFSRTPKLVSVVNNLSVQILGTMENFPYYSLSLMGSVVQISMVSNPPSSLKITLYGGKYGVRDTEDNWMDRTNYYFLLK